MKTLTYTVEGYTKEENGVIATKPTQVYDVEFGLDAEGDYYLEVATCILVDGQRTTPELLQENYTAHDTANHEVFVDLFKFVGLKVALAILESLREEFVYFTEL